MYTKAQKMDWAHEYFKIGKYKMNDNSIMDNKNVQAVDAVVGPETEVIVGYDTDGNVVKVKRLDGDKVQDTEYSDDKEGN